MYLPAHFHEAEATRLRHLIDEYPLATVIATTDEGHPEISHLPCLRADAPSATGVRLLLHVARDNALAALATKGARMTAVFHGPHCHVSPRVFQEPRRQVPTWNYAVVHASGPTSVLSPSELLDLLEQMSAHLESGDAPWRPGLTEPGFVQHFLPAIVGIALHVDRLEGKFKLNQNRSVQDRADVHRALSRGTELERAVAGLMEPRIGQTATQTAAPAGSSIRGVS